MTIKIVNVQIYGLEEVGSGIRHLSKTSIWVGWGLHYFSKMECCEIVQYLIFQFMHS